MRTWFGAVLVVGVALVVVSPVLWAQAGSGSASAGRPQSGVTSFVRLAQFPGVGAWSVGSTYPKAIAEQSCVIVSHALYCIGGVDASGTSVNATYYSELLAWRSMAPYPATVGYQSCVAAIGNVYCIGGYDTSTSSSSSSVYFGHAGPSGIKVWKSGTSYPIAINDQSCVAWKGYVYCVGGSASGSFSNATYFAPISSAGLGTWSASTSYPSAVEFTSCVASAGYIYCFGGQAGYSGNSVKANYYAPISSTGIGSWKSTRSYPTTVAYESCVPVSGYAVCIGGGANSTYYARLQSTGVGVWTASTPYSTGIASQSCAAAYGEVYCVAGTVPGSGLTDATYYASV